MAPSALMVKVSLTVGSAMSLCGIAFMLRGALTTPVQTGPILLAWLLFAASSPLTMWGVLQGRNFEKRAFGRVLLCCMYAPLALVLALSPFLIPSLGFEWPSFQTLGGKLTLASGAILSILLFNLALKLPLPARAARPASTFGHPPPNE